jgi:hypothetical protein
MATYVQRAQAIADALYNGVASPAMVNRIGLGIAASEGRETEYGAMTNAQKAEFIVRHYRRHTIQLVSVRDERIASLSATTSAHAAVETEFAEAP